MEETFSQDFKRIFLLTFTKELIIHSAKKDIIKLQNIIESKEQKIKEMPSDLHRGIFVRELKGSKPPVISVFEKSIEIPAAEKPLQISPVKKPAIFFKPRPFFNPQRRLIKPILKPHLLIPEPKLPSHLEYLKPIPVAGMEIDLLKLNPLIKDNAVRVIEANTNEKVIVNGTMGTKPTDIILNEEDINRVINKFSETSKIPVSEGIYRVVIGNLILSAIISETTGPKFIIKKMATSSNSADNSKGAYPSLPFQNNEIIHPEK
jgi:hypothetical protein